MAARNVKDRGGAPMAPNRRAGGRPGDARRPAAFDPRGGLGCCGFAREAGFAKYQGTAAKLCTRPQKQAPQTAQTNLAIS